MSTPTHTPTHAPTRARHAAPARPVVVPQPRPAAEQMAVEPAGVDRLPPPQGGDQQGLFERHAWLIPAGAIASIVAVFVAMVLLTWIAGGNTPFNR